MDFLNDKLVLFTSKKYEPIYMHLSVDFSIKYYELFILCATLGFKEERSLPLEEKGREFKSHYFNSKQKTTFYSIILNDNELGKNIEAFEDKEFMTKCKKKLEQYAEGGMEILCEELFGNKWQAPVLDSGYEDYDIDIIKFVLEKSMTVPF